MKPCGDYPDAEPILQFLSRLPLLDKRVLLVGSEENGLAAELREAGFDIQEARCTDTMDEIFSLPESSFPCILLTAREEEIPAFLPLLTPLLQTHGSILLVYSGKPEGSTMNLASLGAAGLMLYHVHAEADTFALQVVAGDYSPIDHARALSEAAHPDLSAVALRAIPKESIDVLGDEVMTRLETQLALLSAAKRDPGNTEETWFWDSQKEFYRLNCVLPTLHPSFQCQAAFWDHIGNRDMAVRILRSLLHAAPDAATERQLAAYGEPPAPEPAYESAPTCTAVRSEPRMLIVNHGNSDYGMDTLSHGLSKIIGSENLVEFPWKPTLHGQKPESTGSYPCFFDYPGERRPLEQILGELAEGYYDLIIVADVIEWSDRKAARKIFAAAPDVPVVIVDTWDNCGDLRTRALRHVGLDSVRGYFKREMLKGVDYGPNSFPLPFSYPMKYVPKALPTERSNPLFWAGKRHFGLRQLYLAHLAERFGLNLSESYSKEEYAQRLSHSLMGLNLFGLGFDTVRYWEIPAHGAMLLSDTPPIRIPDNFRDGETAVFFGDLPELEEKLAYYLDHPDEAERIAQAGHEHFKKYHTSEARARQFLARLEQILAE